MGGIAGIVLIFLGIPLVAGYLTRTLGERARGRDWYETTLLPRIGPIALYGLLFTVVVLFALQGRTITSEPLTVARIAVPLLAYFAIMWFAGFGDRARPEPDLPAHHGPGVLRGQQRLRTGDRRGHRRLRRHLRAGPGRRRRPADRGPGPGRPGLRRPVAAAPADLAAERRLRAWPLVSHSPGTSLCPRCAGPHHFSAPPS